MTVLRCAKPEPPFHVVLVEPEIPPNTGSVARTCGATGSVLHLVHPLGFDVSERAVRRAGLDYWHLVEVVEHASAEAFLAQAPLERLVLFTTESDTAHTAHTFTPGDYLVFGKESVGLSDGWKDRFPDQQVSIPMPGHVRSLNLSNSVAIGLYEALRQQNLF